MNKDSNPTKTLAEISAELRRELTGSNYSIAELRRIYLHTNVSEHFCIDNPSNIPVRTYSIEEIVEDSSCQNCWECICLRCDHREGNHYATCVGRCSYFEDMPINTCDEFKEAD